MTETIAKQLKSLPQSPGVYSFRDAKGEILYIGKANALRSRVRSYFSKSNDLSASKQIMVKKIAGIETTITSNEQEALILESIMVKKHKPRFNVSLKDDKSYNFIKIDYRYPRPVVTTVRRPEHDAGRSRAKYFGPYTSGQTLYENLRILRRIFPYRKPARGWSASGRKQYMTPFEEDLLKKRSLGPIPQTDEEYCDMISRLIRVLSGNTDGVLRDLKARMRTLSENRQYETAARVRDQIKNLELIQSRQKIMSVRGGSRDVISIYREGDTAAVNVFVIRVGKLIDKLNFLLQHTAGESMTALCDAFLAQYYSEASNLPREIILPARTSLSEDDIRTLSTIDRHPGGREAADRISTNNLQDSIAASTRLRNDGVGRVKVSIPSRGKKRQLIKLGEENAKEYLEQSLASWEKAADDALRGLKDALKLKELPRRIEGYDISNIQGQLSVGSMVVSVDGTPDTNEYRKFKIKTVKGADDVASLAEVLKRRFKNDGWPRPDLVLLDGGKGQLSAVIKALFIRHPGASVLTSDRISVNSKLDSIGLSTSLQNDGITPHQFIALAKREEEVFQGKDLKKIELDPASGASRLLQRIRDEAHRFGQKYYHTRHAKAETQSVLDEAPGIGPKTKKLLIQKFGSAAGIRTANKDAIIKLIGEAKTKTLLENI